MRKNRAIWCALVFLVLFFVVSAGFGERETVRVGYMDYPGLVDKKEDGNYDGYSVTYLNEIARYTGWNYEYVFGSWEECLQRLKNGEIDLLCSAQYSPERAKDYDYAAQPTGKEYGLLVVREDNNTIYYDDYEGFGGLRIAMLRDSFQNLRFEEYAQSHSFTYEPVYYALEQEMSNALRSGEVDAMVAGSLARQTDCRVVAKFSVDDFYFTTTKGNRKVLDGLNGALEKIRANDLYYEAKLYEKYYGGSAVFSQPLFTREDAEYIKTAPPLRVVARPDWQPFGVYSEDGSYDGITADILSRVSEISGLTFDYIPVSSYEDCLEKLRAGEADLLAGEILFHSDMENADGFLSQSYLDIPAEVIWRRDEPAPEGNIRIAVTENSPFGEAYFSRIYQEYTMVPFDSLHESLAGILQGKADVAFESAYSVNNLLKSEDFSRLEASQISVDMNLTVAVGVSAKADSRLRSVLDKSIAVLTTDDLTRAVFNSSVEPHVVTLQMFWMKYQREITGLLLLAAAILLGFVLFLRKKQRKKLEYFAFTDQKLECPNLNYFKEQSRALLPHGDGDYYVLRFDVNNFKYINKTYGTQAGDAFLYGLAHTFMEGLSEKELFARVSDDNFVMLVKESTLRFLMGEYRNKLDALQRELKMKYAVMIKAGYCKVTDQEEPVESFLDKAALAKKSIKDNPQKDFQIFNDVLFHKIMKENQIEMEMEDALKNGEFQVYIQPQIQLETMRIAGAEALIRWRKPDGSMIYPDEFIPLFERNGFIEKLDFFVLEEVCSHVRALIDSGGSIFPVSVNQSRYLLNNPDYVSGVNAMMEKYQIPSNLLELELTESLFSENKQMIISAMEELHSIGVILSIDDFGSGYSSLNLLTEIPADVLKIDRGFLSESDHSEPKKLVIQKVVELAHILSIKVVCEGVETEAQADFLKSVECNFAQGFLYARPMPINTFFDRIKADAGYSSCEQGW